MKIPTVRNVAKLMMMILRLIKKPGLVVTTAGGGFTMAVPDLKESPPKKQRLNAGSAKLKNKTNHKLRNITIITYLMLIRIDKCYHALLTRR